MKNLFEQLHQNEKLPAELEKEILRSYDSLKLFAEITDLFTEKLVRANIDFFLKVDQILDNSDTL